MIRIATLAAALACAAAAHAAPLIPQPLSKEEVKAQKLRIEEQFDHAQTRCRRVEGHARELCNEQARGERDVQSAELEMNAQPSPENDEKIRLARAEAAYSLSLVKCKSLEGHARGICRKDAKSTYEMARTEARLQRDVVEQTLRSELTVRDRTAAADRIADAQFNAARERCEMLPGEGRANCLLDARKRFGKL